MQYQGVLILGVYTVVQEVYNHLRDHTYTTHLCDRIGFQVKGLNGSTVQAFLLLYDIHISTHRYPFSL